MDACFLYLHPLSILPSQGASPPSELSTTSPTSSPTRSPPHPRPTLPSIPIPIDALQQPPPARIHTFKILTTRDYDKLATLSDFASLNVSRHITAVLHASKPFNLPPLPAITSFSSSHCLTYERWHTYTHYVYILDNRWQSKSQSQLCTALIVCLSVLRGREGAAAIVLQHGTVMNGTTPKAQNLSIWNILRQELPDLQRRWSDSSCKGTGSCVAKEEKNFLMSQTEEKGGRGGDNVQTL